MFEDSTLENELVAIEADNKENSEEQEVLGQSESEEEKQEALSAEEAALSPVEEEEESDQEEPLLALPEVITSGDEYPSAPKSIFLSSGDESFVQLTRVLKRQMRDYKFFLKFQKYVPVTHFSERPERSPHTYEKKYWNLTLFSRFCCVLRQKAKHLSTAPFSLSGDYAMFEKEILYSPQKCPIYVHRSRSIMESNLKRFKRVLDTTHRDVYNSESLLGYISEDEPSIKLGRFVKGKSGDLVDEEKGQDMPLIQNEENLQSSLEGATSLE